MITAYFLIAAFAIGLVVGSIWHSEENPPTVQWILVMLLALAWPLLIYVYWKDWKEGKL